MSGVDVVGLVVGANRVISARSMSKNRETVLVVENGAGGATVCARASSTCEGPSGHHVREGTDLGKNFWIPVRIQVLGVRELKLRNEACTAIGRNRGSRLWRELRGR